MKTGTRVSPVEAEELNQSQIVRTCIAIVILPLLLPIPTIWFAPVSLDNKRNVTDGVESGVARKSRDVLIPPTPISSRLWILYDSDFWFLLGHKGYYDTTYDSDSDSITETSLKESWGLLIKPRACALHLLPSSSSRASRLSLALVHLACLQYHLFFLWHFLLLSLYLRTCRLQ